MRYQDQVVKTTMKALDDVCRAARAVPPDKQRWSPQGEARSTLDQMREIALQTPWFVRLLREKAPPEVHDDTIRAAMAQTQGLTVEECVEAARRALPELCEAIEQIADEELEHEIDMPFGGGMRMTLADVMLLPSWNMTYHLGQINYVQLMLGDKKMH
ncbi:MAG: DinB family protein [Fimbriimonadaceae bacterium]|nr:DinB family protein [Fimbriimonadaceae bacterium]